MSIGKALLRLRGEKGLTQADLARKARLAVSYLSRLENDHVQPTVGTLQRIADALGVPVTLFFQYSPAEVQSVAACPVSTTGRCVGELIRSDRGRPPRKASARYGQEELRLLRMTDFLVTHGSREVRRALALVLDSMVQRTQRENRRRG